MKKELIMLVGVPGSGKSTWRNSKYNKFKDCTAIFSTDDIIEEIALNYGMTYSEIFKDCITLAEKVAFHKLDIWFKNEHTRIVIDRTNMSKKARKKILDKVPDDYEKTCIVFAYPEDIEARLASRPGKIIPMSIISDMLNRFEKPSLEEGFDFLYSAKE